jgi:hypothetical protein
LEGFVGQRIILIKELPSREYIADLVERGVLRAGMTFLPGSCYAGAGIYPETTMYAMSGSADASASDACPDPGDTVGCLQWEIFELLHKLSYGFPQSYNAFVFAQVRAGSRDQWAKDVEGVLGDLVGDGDYFANGHLMGCGPYNVVFELLTEDHQRLQRVILALTDKEYVEDVMVGHLAAADALGFGESGTAS